MRKPVFFAFLNLLILIGALVVGMYAHVAARRYFAKDTIFIAPLLNESHLHLNMDNVDALERQFISYSFSAESRRSLAISSSTQTALSTVVYTDTVYFSIHFMEFSDGSHRQDGSVIIINEALAWRLFGSGDIIGLTVEINQLPYTVTGVVRQDSRGRGEYMAWIPREASPASLPVTALYIRAHSYNMVDVEVETRRMLTNLYRNPASYAIVDINRYVEAISIRSRVLMYTVWVYVILLLIRLVIAKITALVQKNMKMREVLGLILPMLGVFLAAYVLFTGINDILYWLPNLANPNTVAWRSITNVGQLPPDGYLSFGLRQLAMYNRIGNWAWAVGAIAFVNVLFSGRPLSTKAI